MLATRRPVPATRPWTTNGRWHATAAFAAFASGLALLGASCADAPTSPNPREPAGVFAKGGNGGGGGGGGGGSGSGYAVLVLEPPPGYTVVEPKAINNNREVVGTSLFYPKGSSWPTTRQAVFWSHASGGLTVQPLPGAAPGSEAFAVNSAGDVGGTDGTGRAVIWERSGGTWTQRVLPVAPGSSGGGVIGLNDAGEAIGYAAPAGDGAFFSVFWDATGAVQALPIPPPFDTSAGGGVTTLAISASGHVVGWTNSFTLKGAPVFWARTGTGHQPILLSHLPDHMAEAHAVAEEAGGVVRVAGVGGAEDGLYALRWTLAYNAASGAWEEIGREQLGAADGWSNARGHGINATGDVVGLSMLDQKWGTPQAAAILWRASRSVESLPGITSRSAAEAFAVNDELWAIGTSVASGYRRGVVWRPEGS